MVTFSLMAILTVYHLGEAAMRSFIFKEKEEASNCFLLWKWSVGSLTVAWLLTQLNTYLLQQGF